MRPLSWSAELAKALTPWQRVLVVVCLCAAALPLWFAATNTYRFVEGEWTKTQGNVHCEWSGHCRGEWTLPGERYGKGDIEGLTFADDEEERRDIPLFAGRDWAVTDRSGLLVRAIVELVCSGLGAVVVLWTAWSRT